MVQMMIEMPESAVAALRKSPEQFASELRLAAAVKWCEMRQLSQERSASIARPSRAELLDASGRFGVAPVQTSAHGIL